MHFFLLEGRVASILTESLRQGKKTGRQKLKTKWELRTLIYMNFYVLLNQMHRAISVSSPDPDPEIIQFVSWST